MKRILLLMITALFVFTIHAQKTASLQTIDKNLKDFHFEATGVKRYKLYPTKNIYNFLKLDTQTGIIKLIQLSFNKDEEGALVVNGDPLDVPGVSGTFELYPTENMYTFILVNNFTGWTWHVQWGFSAGERFIRPISFK